MQLGQAQIVRSNWYDRAPLNVNGMYTNQLVPHAAIDRINYTVPNNRRARVTLSDINVMRMTAAAPVGNYRVPYFFTPNGGGEVLLGIFSRADNTLYNHQYTHFNGLMILSEGDNLRFESADFSTAGSLIFTFGCTIFEYDA